MKKKLLGNQKKGLFFVMSAPAGTGKTTLAKMLVEEFSCVVESVSVTTRAPRPGEVHGREYFFLTREEFQDKIKRNEFLEYAEVFGNFYGTTRALVQKQELSGKHVILVIDTQGAMQLKGKIPATFIFLMPPNLEELRRRLLSRKTENSQVIEERLARAEHEIGLAREYDYVIINDDLETAYEVLRSVVIAEEHRAEYQII